MSHNEETRRGVAPRRASELRSAEQAECAEDTKHAPYCKQQYRSTALRMTTPVTARVMSAPPKFTFARACAEYDDEFREHLLTEITEAIGLASIVPAAGGQRVMALRTGEQLDALLGAVAGTLTMMPAMSDERELRRATAAIAKRLRRDVARARAAGVADRLGAARGGRA